MIEQVSNPLTFYAFYTTLGIGQAGLTVVADVYKNGVALLADQATTAIGGGLYSYILAVGSVDTEGEYIVVFKTATATVDQQHLPALWVVGRAGIENLNATISSRAAAGAQMDLVNAPNATALQAAADALLDRTAGVETGHTPRQSLRLMLAALAGKLSGANTTTVRIRDTGDSKDRIVATVDQHGNRTDVVEDVS